jgi:Protein of unknown function (DUF4240)
MDEKQFWNIIELSRKNARNLPDLQFSQLKTLLTALSETEFFDFYNLFARLYTQSYTGRLWGAAYIILGGCSDEGFDYFREWLMLQGKEAFYNALENPDSLVKIASDDNDPIVDAFLPLLEDIAIEKTGLEDFSDKLQPYSYPAIDFDDWYDVKSDDLDEKKAKKCFPKLYKTFW